MTFEKLLNKVKSYQKKKDLDILISAYNFANEAHKEHYRLSGDPFIMHPLSVAYTLAELEQDISTLAAALLHDTMEDRGVSREELLKLFSEEIVQLVEGVTKLGQLVYETKEKRQAENFRKMFVAMGQDYRVILIKLADRLHNMQTVEFLPPAKRRETSLETRDIFAPLAHRLGMWRLKWELEDLAFQHLESEDFKDIKGKIAETRESREKYTKDFIKKLKAILSEVKIKAQIYGRPKHFYSIYQKMKEQHLEFSEIYDLIAVRVIVRNVKECYAALGMIHATWKPIPGRFKDYVAVPKSNGYQSLHTTVVGMQGKPVEIQIRTKEMHQIAEYGIAAHWAYKEKVTDKEFDKKMAWFRQIMEVQAEIADAKDFMDNLKIGLFTDEVFVFTPKGEVKQLPLGSTPIDFAYYIHTEIGHRCMGAKINGRIVPLNYKMQNGDIVEVVTSKVDSPKLAWLNFVRTPAARNKIKSWFKKVKRDEIIDKGREVLIDNFKKEGIDINLLKDENVSILLKEMRFDKADDLFAAVGYGEISPLTCVRRLKIKIPLPIEEEIIVRPTRKVKKKKGFQGVKVSGLEHILVKFSRCCRPIPGDEIIGFVTQGKGVSIHRKDCSNFVRLKIPPEKMIKVEWDTSQEILYPVGIEIEAFDRVGVFKDVLAKIAETETNVFRAGVTTKRGSVAFLKLGLDVKDLDHLSKVTKAIRQISDVYDVRRVELVKK